MNQFTPSAMFTGIGLSFVAGFSLAWYLYSSESPEQMTTASAGPAATAVKETAGLNKFPELWSSGASEHLSAPKKNVRRRNLGRREVGSEQLPGQYRDAG